MKILSTIALVTVSMLSMCTARLHADQVSSGSFAGALSTGLADEPVVTSPATGKKDKAQDHRSKVTDKAIPRGAVITMGERNDMNMVGVFLTAETLRRMMPMLEEEKVDVVVFRFYSGGGYGSEVMPMSDVVEEYKKKFVSVAWIESAISAAAMTAHTFEDIYFTSQGNYGACTGFYGSLDRPVTGRELEKALAEMEVISGRGKHDPKIMRAMQISSSDEDVRTLQIAPPTGALSANIDENGDVMWFQDSTSGKYVINPSAGRRILTFNSETAEKFKFSRGTADTLDELAKKMGFQEIEWVGEKDSRYLYPVCKAEKFNLKFRANTMRDQEHFREYYRSFNMNYELARAEQDKQRRGAYVAKCRQAIENVKRMVRNNPNFAPQVLGVEVKDFPEWVENIEKQLRELMR